MEVISAMISEVKSNIYSVGILNVPKALYGCLINDLQDHACLSQ